MASPFVPVLTEKEGRIRKDSAIGPFPPENAK